MFPVQRRPTCESCRHSGAAWAAGAPEKLYVVFSRRLVMVTFRCVRIEHPAGRRNILKESIETTATNGLESDRKTLR
jgi:hypothetical protein